MNDRQRGPAARAAPNGPRWHAEAPEEALRRLAATPDGLSDAEAARRLREHGPNALAEAQGPTAIALFARQFKSPLVWLLFAAAGLSVAFGHAADAIAVLAILVINACVGFWQEHRAEASLAALRKATSPTASVRRDGAVRVIPAAELVPGDVIELQEGDAVPADARLLDAASLRVVEASLTGESEPVDKVVEPVDAETPLADRTSMVYQGTGVAGGEATALVVATGSGTEIGRIGDLLAEAGDQETPLQKRLVAFGRLLGLVALGVTAVVFALGAARGRPLDELLLGAVSLAVAAVPEGLPVVVTIALAAGVRRMARRRTLVRRLHAVETLGAVTAICSDKTGTLTVGQMTLRRLLLPGRRYDFEGEGYAPEGRITGDGAVAPEADPLLDLALRTFAGCTSARLERQGGGWTAVGDPTEAALLAAAGKAGLTPEAVEDAAPEASRLPFDADRRRMTVVRRLPEGGLRASVKGAPEAVVDRCSRVLGADGAPRPLDDAARKNLLAANERLAAEGLRVLACAVRDGDDALMDSDPETVEDALTFVAFAGLQDPPRPEAARAVAVCRDAGIRVSMITGDQPRTALAIARELGIAGPEDRVVTGADLDRADASFDPTATAVFARVSPEHKVRIVREWRRRGGVVAMTGDGVNDAPALREADVGVAMGKTGTETAKEAADLVVVDDDFATLVVAVEQGRGIYDNIRNTLQYLLAGNAAELLLMLAAAVIGAPTPLLPIQLLWINLATDGVPALALAVDRFERDLMRRPPRRPDERLADRLFLFNTGFAGLLSGGTALGAYLYALGADGDESRARAFAFNALVFAELLKAFAFRSETRTAFSLGMGTNLRLCAVVAVSIGLQLLSHAWAPLADFLRTPRLPLADVAALLALGFVPVTTLELAKGLRLRRERTRRAA